MVLKQLFLAAYSYTCGSARLFNVTLKKGSPPIQRPNQTMTCQWNTTWTPTAVLPVMVPTHINIMYLQVKLQEMLVHHKKLIHIPVPSQDVTYQTLPPGKI